MDSTIEKLVAALKAQGAVAAPARRWTSIAQLQKYLTEFPDAPFEELVTLEEVNQLYTDWENGNQGNVRAIPLAAMKNVKISTEMAAMSEAGSMEGGWL